MMTTDTHFIGTLNAGGIILVRLTLKNTIGTRKSALSAPNAQIPIMRDFLHNRIVKISQKKSSGISLLLNRVCCPKTPVAAFRRRDTVARDIAADIAPGTVSSRHRNTVWACHHIEIDESAKAHVQSPMPLH
jgi:hypothetical protein